MMIPLKRWQKFVAYGSLLLILVCTVLGIGLISLILTDAKL